MATTLIPSAAAYATQSVATVTIHSWLPMLGRSSYSLDTMTRGAASIMVPALYHFCGRGGGVARGQAAGHT